MKITGFIIAVVLASMIFFSYATVSDGFAETYSNTSISNVSELDTSNLTVFSGADNINGTFGGLTQDLENIDSSDGWSPSEIFGGGIAIIKAFTKMPGLIITLMVSTITDVSIVLDSMGIPPALVGGFAIIIMIFIIFKLISASRRHEI